MNERRSQLGDKDILTLLRATMSQIEMPPRLTAEIRKTMGLKAAREVAVAESRATLDELARLAEVDGPGLGETHDQRIRGVLARIYLRFARELFESADDLERNAGEIAKFGEDDEARRRKLAAMTLREHASVMMLRTEQLAQAPDGKEK